LAYASALELFLFSVGRCFFAFFGIFSGDLGFCYNHPHPGSPTFIKFVLSFGYSGPLTVANGPLSTKFSSFGSNLSLKHLFKNRSYFYPIRLFKNRSYFYPILKLFIKLLFCFHVKADRPKMVINSIGKIL